MPLIVTAGQLSQGHGPQSLPIPIPRGVFIKGQPVILQGDNYTPHTIGDNIHNPVAILGSLTVTVGGIPVIRDGDPLSCGDLADTQTQFEVFANGGGNAASILNAQGAAARETVGYFINGITTSYPSILIRGNFERTFAGGASVYTFSNWCSNPAIPSNGFVITLQEEITGNTYQSFQGVGASSLPAAAGEVFRSPLDNQVTYSIVDSENIFNINPSTGALTFNEGFNPTSLFTNTFKRNQSQTLNIKVRVKVTEYISSVINVPFTINLEYNAC